MVAFADYRNTAKAMETEENRVFYVVFVLSFIFFSIPMLFFCKVYHETLIYVMTCLFSLFYGTRLPIRR